MESIYQADMADCGRQELCSCKCVMVVSTKAIVYEISLP